MPKRVMRTVMPAHPGGSISVEEATAAWLRVFEKTRSGPAKRTKNRAEMDDFVPPNPKA